MQTLLAFLLALAILIVIHEYGHYSVARLCGVKVLRFSFGFGRVIWRHQFTPQGTEWVISLFPLGGYVKMLDERETDEAIAAADLPYAFNRQSLAKRAAIVFAGPLANFLLAIAIYWLAGYVGSEEPRPILEQPAIGTVAAQAGIRAGDEVVQAGEVTIRGWAAFQQVLLKNMVAGKTLPLMVERAGERHTLQLAMPLTETPLNLEKDPLNQLGISLRAPAAKIKEVAVDSPAAQAGLKAGDIVQAANGEGVTLQRSLSTLLQTLPKSSDGTIAPVVLTVMRAGQTAPLRIPVAPLFDSKVQQWRIGIVFHYDFPMVTVRHLGWDGLVHGLSQTYEVSALTLRLLGKMLVGQASLKNLSGPLTIADAAGQSAAIGWLPYLTFIAAVSVSLAVFNLLPVPLLDGGHLLYYAAELVIRRAPSERVFEWTQKIGLGLLLMLMSIAFFNDISRYFFH